MTTVLFVHGTGVRSKRHALSLARVRAGVAEVLPGTAVHPCAWGDVLGVPTAAAEEPERGGSGPADGDPRWPDAERAVWARLYDDPLFEIRLAVLEGRETGPSGSPRAAAVFAGRMRALPEHPAVAAALPGPPAGDALRIAAGALTGDREFAAATRWLAAVGAHDLVGRAVAASYVRVREEEAGEVLVPVAERDALARAVTDALGGTPLGAGSRARGVAWTTAQRAARPLLRRHRDGVLERSTPLAGDVLLYQARGRPLRRFIAERVREIDGPVVLLGHSLGGIACFEMLLGEALPQVELLVTVGSQIPYLYGLDALATLRLGAPLPGAFTARWLNLHDPVDLLSFPAAPRFAGRVTDVAVDTGEPFPRAHGAYWTVPAVYAAVRTALAGGPR